MEKFIFTDHALFEMNRRGLSAGLVEKIISKPEQQWEIRKGRLVFQSRIIFDDPQKPYLVRIFVDIDRDPPEVVTVYKTSKIEKYWREDQ